MVSSTVYPTTAMINETSTSTSSSLWNGYIAATVVLFLAFGILMVFIVSLATSKKIRQNALNLYVLLSIIPDWILVEEFAIMTALQVFATSTNKQHADKLQHVHDWVQIFYYVSNFYFNAIIAHELFQLVQVQDNNDSDHRQALPQQRRTSSLLSTSGSTTRTRQSPLTVGKVWIQSGSVFILAGLYAVGLVYTTVKNGGSSSLMITLTHLCIMAIPSIYVLYIYLQGGEPTSTNSTTRQHFLYFMKTMVIHNVFYLPGLFINFQVMREAYLKDQQQQLGTDEQTIDAESWYDLFMSFLFPIQSIIIVSMAIFMIQDVRDECCRCSCCQNDKDSTPSSSMSSSEEEETITMTTTTTITTMTNQEGNDLPKKKPPMYNQLVVCEEDGMIMDQTEWTASSSSFLMEDNIHSTTTLRTPASEQDSPPPCRREQRRTTNFTSLLHLAPLDEELCCSITTTTKP